MGLRREDTNTGASVAGVRLVGADTTLGSVDDLLALARAAAPDPDAFDRFEPWVFVVEASSDRLDAYFTRMSPSTLANYAADASVGVAFQDSHLVRGLQHMLGRSVRGQVIEPSGVEAATRMLAAFYSVRGLTPELEAFEGRLRTGISRDVSVGFKGGTYRCSICGRDPLWDWDCEHLPGFQYMVKNALGVMEPQLAYAWIDDAHLAEVSLVYDGATPGAAVLAAQRHLEQGLLTPDRAAMLEQRYRSIGLKLPVVTRQPVALPTITPTSTAGAGPADARQVTGDEAAGTTGNGENLEVIMAQEPTIDTRDTTADQVVATTPLPVAATDTAGLLALAIRSGAPADATLDLAVRWLADQVATLTPLAEDGRRYRQAVIDQALVAGVRAMGNGFKSDLYRTMLASLPIAAIEQMRDDWQVIGDAQFTAGRKTTDAPPVERAAETTNTDHRPAGAFRA